ncbi:MAG: hypothetical protein IK152_02420 [Lachnospiraceae bacterium]|nr:hypothetical protein [Lachnospiraceae bacterium]
MSDINKVHELYDMMARRFAACAHTPNQARVYAEIRDLIAGCSTVDDSMQKIKNSKYYTAPAQALMLDKMNAYREAARDNKMPELEKIYDEKYREIEADPMKAYEMGYEKKVAARDLKMNQKIAAFNDAYMAYVELLCCGFDKDEIDRHCRDIKKALEEMDRACESFASLAGQEMYRKLVPANDTGFRDFVSNAPGCAQNPPDRSHEKAAFEKEFNELWSSLSAKKGQITEMGRKELGKARYAACLAIPPKDRTGHYEFELRQEEMPC